MRTAVNPWPIPSMIASDQGSQLLREPVVTLAGFETDAPSENPVVEMAGFELGSPAGDPVVTLAGFGLRYRHTVSR